jgi:hypothetical protein
VLGQEVAFAATGDPRRHHARGDHRRVGGRKRDDPPPVHGHPDRLPDPHVVERRLGRIEAQVLERQRRNLAQRGSQLGVVPNPGGVEAPDRRVVELTVGECIDGTRAADVGDQPDSPDGRRTGPVPLVRAEREQLVCGGLQDITAAAHELAGLEQVGVVVDRGHDRERRAGHDGREVGTRPVEIDDDGVAFGAQADGFVPHPAGKAVRSTAHGQHERSERRRTFGFDDPQPAPDHVGGSQRGAVGEREPWAEAERHLASVVGDGPGLREGGPKCQPGVERRERFEQLGGDGGAARIALGGWIEAGRSIGEDRDLARRGRTGATAVFPARCHEHDRGHEDDDDRNEDCPPRQPPAAQ